MTQSRRFYSKELKLLYVPYLQINEKEHANG